MLWGRCAPGESGHESNPRRTRDRRQRRYRRSRRLPLFSTLHRAHGMAGEGAEDRQGSGVPAWRPVLRRGDRRRAAPARRLVLRGAAAAAAARGRPLRLLARREGGRLAMAKRTFQGFATSLAVAGMLSFGVGADGAELKVISAGAVRGVIGGMIDDYARLSGHTFKFTVGSTGRLREIIASGEPADLIIASAPLMAELEATGRMTPGSRVDIGRIGLGVVIREGAVAPDVSTPDALRQALVNATSIAYTDPKLGGTSYVHLMKIAGTFGIADVVAGKGVHATGGNDAVAKVAAGEAELAIVLISE